MSPRGVRPPHPLGVRRLCRRFSSARSAPPARKKAAAEPPHSNGFAGQMDERGDSTIIFPTREKRASSLLLPRHAGEKVPKADEGVLLACIFVLALLLPSCHSTRPGGSPVTPLTAVTIEETAAQLGERRASFAGMKSLMHVRATANGKTQSFRAQLIVHDAQRMELIAYTPVGTTALNMKANGQRVHTDPAVPPESFAFLQSAGLTPAETGMLILGVPPRDDLSVTFGIGGIAEATAGGMTAAFDPPAFPAKRVVITRGSDRIEIEHLEVVSP